MSTIFMHIYNESFKLRAMDCMNSAIAVATGAYEFNNYYYYAFLYACSKKWLMKSDSNEMECLKSNLNVLGLDISEYFAETKETAIKIMSELVRQDRPVILFVPYNRLFYTVNYNTENAARHGLLFIGYVEDRDSFMLMDSVQMWGPNQEFNGSSETFIRFPVSRDVFNILLNDTALGYKELIGKYCIPFFSIDKIGASSVNSYSELFSRFVGNKNSTLNRVVSIIDKIDEHKKRSKDFINTATHLRQELNGTNEILMWALERLVLEKRHDSSIYERFEEVKRDYTKVQDFTTLKLIKELMSKSEFDMSEKEKLKETVLNNDSKLFEFIEDLLKLPSATSENKLTNLTSNAELKSDSGSPILIHPLKHDSTILWESNTLPCDHWLEIDLKELVTVREITIIHSGIAGLTTSDYQLQFSIDGRDYFTVVDVKDNCRAKTNYLFENKQARYVRFYVTKASEYECNVRIKGMQIWGTR